MNCQGVLDTVNKGLSGSTVAERNAACIHCRGCDDCYRMLIEGIKRTPPEIRIPAMVRAVAAFVKDRSDPEWK